MALRWIILMKIIKVVSVTNCKVYDIYFKPLVKKL